MKVAEFAEILASIAKNHPEADVRVCFPSRHAGRPTTKLGSITGYRIGVSEHPAVKPNLRIEIEYARSENVEENTNV